MKFSFHYKIIDTTNHVIIKNTFKSRKEARAKLENEKEYWPAYTKINLKIESVLTVRW